MIKICQNYDELTEYIGSIMDDESLAINVIQNDDKTYKVEVVNRKQYVSYTGDTHFDEVWLTAKNEMIQIQDMSESHVRNALRMILRSTRLAKMKYVQELANEIDAEFGDDIEAQDIDSKELRQMIAEKMAGPVEDLNLSDINFVIPGTNTLQ